VAARRLAFLDGMRGVAALWVVLFHAAAGQHITHFERTLPSWLDVEIFSSGYFGVPVFFVLSGFVIAYSVGGERVGTGYLARFALRRAIRLGLPYWASIVLALAFLALKSAALHEPLAPPTVAQVAAHALYLQDALGVPEINSVYWTLCQEMQLYLLFCLMLAAAQRLRFPVLAAAAMLALAWPLFGSPFPALCFSYWHGFLLGVLACWALSGVIRPRWFVLYTAALAALWLRERDAFTLVCVAAGTLIYAAGAAGCMDRWLRSRELQFLAMVSYSLYLIHNPVMGAGFNIAYRVLPHSALGEAAALLAVLGLACAFAYGFWWLIERPSTALSHLVHLSQPRLAPRTASLA
jgi:peptidoglycan/LPS O-acetylase OafA/YrhL